MNWVDYYRIYLGLKLHFDSSSYDYRKYGPKKVKEDSIKRMYLTLKSIEGKHESRDAFESRCIGIFRNKVKYVTELYTPESTDQVHSYLSEVFSFSYNLKTDMEVLISETECTRFREIFFSDNEYRIPPVVSMYIQGKIKFHSLCALDKLIGFCDKINPMIFDVKIVERYQKLHSFNLKEIVAIVKPFKISKDS